MELLGVNGAGLNGENGRKLLLSLVFIATVLVVSTLLRWIGIASATDEIVGLPPIEVRSVPAAAPG